MPKCCTMKPRMPVSVVYRFAGEHYALQRRRRGVGLVEQHQHRGFQVPARGLVLLLTKSVPCCHGFKLNRGVVQQRGVVVAVCQVKLVVVEQSTPTLPSFLRGRVYFYAARSLHAICAFPPPALPFVMFRLSRT